MAEKERPAFRTTKVHIGSWPYEEKEKANQMYKLGRNAIRAQRELPAQKGGGAGQMMELVDDEKNRMYHLYHHTEIDPDESLGEQFGK